MKPRSSWPNPCLVWHRASLGAKLGSIVFLCMIAATVSGVGYFFKQARTEARVRAESLAADRADDGVGKTERNFARALSAVSSTRNGLVALALYNPDRHVGDLILKHMLDTDPFRYGSWTVWKPEAFDGRDKDFIGRPNSDETGRYLSYWHQDGTDVVLDRTRGYDKPDAPLYRTPLDGGGAFLSEPYYILRSGDKPAAIVSYSEPIVVGGKIRGAIGTDIDLAILRDGIAALTTSNAGANVTLVSNGGTVIGTSRPDLAGSSLAERGNPLAAAFIRAKASGRLDEVGGGATGPILRSWRRVTFNSVKTPWYLYSEMPIRDFTLAGLARRIPTAAVAGFGIFAAILLVILAALRSLVTRPLANIENYLKSLRLDGAIDDCAEAVRLDEIGSIARTLVTFKASEAEIGRLKFAEGEREAQFAALRHAEQQQLADQLVQSVQSVSRLVESTALTIMQRAESVADTAVTSAQTTRVIAEASSAAAHSVGAVDEAAVALKQSIDSIALEMSNARRIAKEAADKAAISSAVTSQLSSHASRIGEIVATIGSIASRTNLLALNATIEAARAGEAGRGFAVVAQEVKALATQTTQATGEIARQIAAMRETAQDAAATLTRIGGTIAEINAVSSSIGVAVAAQGDATARIELSLDGAVAASRRVNAAVVDADRATSQTGAAAADMLAETAKLADESARLNEEVLDFITKIRAA